MEKLINKVPEFLFENVEVRAVFEAIEPELVLIANRTEQMVKNIHPETADSNGLKVYEEWLGIAYDRTLNLGERRIEILARLNETLPYTEIRLQRFLAGSVGWGNFHYYRDGAFVKVSVKLDSGKSILSIIDMLERVLPMNLHFEINQQVESKDETKIILNSACHVKVRMAAKTKVEGTNG